uniref:GIT domain-containing protein n=1 Tax=Macrostomum lignano TaxID=282301 RepID=A0A1I8I203_9PLAT
LTSGIQFQFLQRATVAAHRANSAAGASAAAPPANAEPSTIGQYIARFRANPPAGRGDREPANPADFWWLGPDSAGADASALSPSPPPDASLGTGAGGKLRRRSNPQHFEPYGRRERPRSLSRSSGGVAGFGPDECAEEEAEDTATANSDEFELVQEVEETPYRPRFVESSSAAAAPAENDSANQQDDILAQWRSRRRLQLARDAAAAPADGEFVPQSAPDAHGTDVSLFQRPLNDVANHLSERLHAAEIEQRLRLRLARLGQACPVDRWAQTDDWPAGSGFKSAAAQTDEPDFRHRDAQTADVANEALKPPTKAAARRSKSTQTPSPPPPSAAPMT